MSQRSDEPPAPPRPSWDPWARAPLGADPDATIDLLRGRLHEAEEALRAIAGGEVDSVRSPEDLNHQLFGPAHRSLDLVSQSYHRLSSERDAVFEALPSQMAVLDDAGQVVAVNRAWRRFADDGGLAMPDHGIGSNYIEVCRRADPRTDPEAAEAERGLRDVLDGRRDTFALEYPCHSPQEQRWYRLLASPLPSSGAVVLHVDVSELKLAHEALVHSERQLAQSQRLEALGRLAGGVAHDFNNLLTAINGFGDLLRQRLPEGSELHPFAHEICKAGDRAAALTRRLLAFGRRQVSRPQVFDLNHKLRDLESLLRRMIGEDHELAARLEADPADVWADPGQMEQVLFNLVVNARDATPVGGRVEISTLNGELPERRRPSGGDGNGGGRGASVVLRVRDWGVGMDRDTLSHVFEPFFTTKPEGKGTGLGLATVYGIAEQAGGHVEVASTPGAGSDFRVHWQAAPASVTAEASPERLAAPAEDGDPATILVVEDEAAVRQLIRQVLGPRGHRLLEAGDGAAALRLARREPSLDLLLTDLVLPGMNGRQVATRVSEYHPRARVLFMTGYSRDELAQRIGQGPDSLLDKPFTPSELLQRVRSSLRGSANGVV